ncbi:hypothetical protein N8I77_013661 [Diaporthe amygdali]|uniref:Uncharacterized protein n=1 Tax=Phomopsis amygdali TaxID=1214568 RepID=A0AAD9VYG1_PHOAM|nr:hypothetical protein N8I77_013661 [Diaporthe amygdali]
MAKVCFAATAVIGEATFNLKRSSIGLLPLSLGELPTGGCLTQLCRRKYRLRRNIFARLASIHNVQQKNFRTRTALKIATQDMEWKDNPKMRLLQSGNREYSTRFGQISVYFPFSEFNDACRSHGNKTE